MSSLGTSKGVLEIAKFSVYVTVPIGLMYFFANNTKNLQKIMGNVVAFCAVLVDIGLLKPRRLVVEVCLAEFLRK